MKLILTLSTDEKSALRKLATAVGASMEDAAKTGLRSWLIKNGYLDSETADNDNEETETQGEA